MPIWFLPLLYQRLMFQASLAMWSSSVAVSHSADETQALA
jgi:hypothetical protein